MYILLPDTKAPQVTLLKQALQEMRQVYSRPQLAYRFVWFYHILRRTDTMSEEDKQIITEVLRMQFIYEELIHDDPIIQKLFAEYAAQGEARGEARGRLEGEIKATKEAILTVLTIRFSSALAAQAQSTITPIEDAERLKELQRALLLVPNEQAARVLLQLPAQGDFI